MKKKDLDKIIKRHQHWLDEDRKNWEDMRADLSGADLSYADLSGANLSGANLSGANLSDARLTGANLTGANLSDARLTGAKLFGANLQLADIYTAIFDANENKRKGIVLKKAIKGFKKTAEGVVITAEIPAGVPIFSINGSKCRTCTATITDMGGRMLLHSTYDPKFTYTLGKKIVITDFDTRYNVECGAGFHFFRTRKEAEEY